MDLFKAKPIRKRAVLNTFINKQSNNGVKLKKKIISKISQNEEGKILIIKVGTNWKAKQKLEFIKPRVLENLLRKKRENTNTH